VVDFHLILVDMDLRLFSQGLEQRVLSAYRRLESLGQGDPDIFVAIRPSLEVKDGVIRVPRDLA
jgi:hypothetical protein